MKSNSLKTYAESLFETAKLYGSVDKKVSLKVINLPFYPAGHLKYDKNLGSATIKINLHQTKQHTDKKKIDFDIACALFHEIEHTKTFFDTQNENFYSFEHLLGLMEFLYYANTLRIKYNKSSINVFKALQIKKQTDKNYDVSTTEIYANLIGYSNALILLEDRLEDENIDLCTDIIKALKLLNSNMEVYYDFLGHPNDKFSLFLKQTYIYVKKHPDIISKYPILKNLFHQDGNIKSLKEIYDCINPENEDMYKKIIIHYIIAIEIDFQELFKDKKFKYYIKDLIDNYISDTINYIKNIELFKMFIDKNKILNDNLSLRKKNISYLNIITNSYNLDFSNGIVIDNSSIGNQKKLHNF